MYAIPNNLLHSFDKSYDQIEEIVSCEAQNWQQEKRNARVLRIALVATAAGLYAAHIASAAIVGAVLGMKDPDFFAKTFLIGGAVAIASTGAIAKIVQHQTGMKESYAGLIGATIIGAVIGGMTQNADAGWISGILLSGLALTYAAITPNREKRAYEVIE